MEKKEHVSWVDYIPPESYDPSEHGGKGWLEYEYARQKRLKVRTGQRFKIIFHSDSRKDEVITLEAFEEPIE